jgi:hypothetical protein
VPPGEREFCQENQDGARRKGWSKIAMRAFRPHSGALFHKSKSGSPSFKPFQASRVLGPDITLVDPFRERVSGSLFYRLWHGMRL